MAMKKKLLCLALAAVSVFSCAFTGCGSNDTPPEPNPGGDIGNAISVDPLDLGEGFNKAYYPVKDKIEQRSGKIDVVIVFAGSEAGWQALANEYSRLHGGAVAVVLNKKYSSGTYKDALKYEITNKNTDWDIVQGNIVTNLIGKYCLNMYPYINGKNGYAGNKSWSSVIEEDAYITDKSGTNTSTYIMNSENLLTAWFVNKTALDAAAELGYRNKEGKAENPVTWDDLISLCDYMQKAGYKNPLGVSINQEGINEYSFSWLLRVYGDYYFRNEYDGIMANDKSGYVYDPASENPENDINYGVDVTKLFNKILYEKSDKYIGPKSAKFKEFVGQLGKMSPYFDAVNAKQASMEDLRNEFQTQSSGKESPQIVLDYVGSGLEFLKSDKIETDFFDYPAMVSEGNYIPEGTIVRDVGGNGGYLSIIDHDAAQDALNLDFMKFVMSPYGQSIYYDALKDTNYTPKGLTLVKQKYVKVPEAWREFFQTDKVTFTGLVDSNEFIRNMVVSIGGQDVADTKVKIYQNYLVGVGKDKIDADNLTSTWASTLYDGWVKYATQNGWSITCYKDPGHGTKHEVND